MIDPAELGQLTMRLMERIEADPEYNDSSVLLKAMVVVEIATPNEDDVEAFDVTFQWATTDNSPASRVGLALQALRGMMRI